MTKEFSEMTNDEAKLLFRRFCARVQSRNDPEAEFRKLVNETNCDCHVAVDFSELHGDSRMFQGMFRSPTGSGETIMF